MAEAAETTDSETPPEKISSDLNQEHEPQRTLGEKTILPKPLSKARAIVVSALVVLTQLIQVRHTRRLSSLSQKSKA